jgi:hypothetical protein
MRIDDMKSQFLIREAEQNLDDSASEHLIGTHAVCPGSPGLCFAAIQVLQDFLGNGSRCINDGADRFQLFALGMIFDVGHQGHLFSPILLRAPFLFLSYYRLVGAIRYTTIRSKVPAQNAFFMLYK